MFSLFSGIFSLPEFFFTLEELILSLALFRLLFLFFLSGNFNFS